MLPKDQQKIIFSDTRACMYHKVGTTVLTGTDNAVLTKMVSLAATGIYSNYSMILTGIQSFISQILGNFTASVGNAIQSMSQDDYYNLFKKINFSGFWISSVVTVGLYATVDNFILVWLGSKYVLDQFTTIILCIQFYLTLTRITNGAFINAAGLFVKDKIRPLIEAILNLVISIILAKEIGIAGVFLGTIISAVVTVQWRDPYILYKFSFKRSVWEYWKVFAVYTFLTVIACFLVYFINNFLFLTNINWGILILEGMFSVFLINFLLFLVFKKTKEFSFFIDIIKMLVLKVVKIKDA